MSPTQETAPLVSPPRSPTGTSGTLLEGAFLDPAYSQAEDGAGKNGIELKASTKLLNNVGGSSFPDEKPVKPKFQSRKVTETEVVTYSRCGFLRCCKESSVVDTHTKIDSIQDPKEKARMKANYLKQKNAYTHNRREVRAHEYDMERYASVPEGIFIYRLDTASRSVSLASAPGENTNLSTLITELVVVEASPSRHRSRRGITLKGENGEVLELVACEQRTATSWMEALHLMLGGVGGRSMWGGRKQHEMEHNNMEAQYLNLTAYSNNLIRTGAIPSHKGKKKTTGGIYYAVSKNHEEGEEVEEEALESIAKRRAVIKDSWDFYRMICSLLRDRRKYDEAFRRMQLDPVYPYLNSMTGLNDPGDDSEGSEEVTQKDLKEYSNMTRTQVCKALIKQAEEALPSLVEICKALAGSLGMEEVGVGPIKEVSSAIKKAEKKYDGDVLKVKDYCRALLVVKDIPTLLALLELARDSFGPIIHRVKLSTLKNDHDSLAGGYRDCKLNLELKGHICEIHIHVWPMWVICGIDGFRHYRHCLEYATDTFKNPYDALANLDDKTLAELVIMAEEAVAGMPLDNLEWYHEKYILDYFAEVGLFLKHDLSVWAETTLRQLIKLRCDSPDIGPTHEETIYLQRYLEHALRNQNKRAEANDIKGRLATIESSRRAEKEEATKSLWDSLFIDPQETLDLIMDPNKKEREEEKKLKKEVKASKRAWRKIRKERFAFLDATNINSVEGKKDEKEVTGGGGTSPAK